MCIYTAIKYSICGHHAVRIELCDKKSSPVEHPFPHSPLSECKRVEKSISKPRRDCSECNRMKPSVKKACICAQTSRGVDRLCGFGSNRRTPGKVYPPSIRRGSETPVHTLGPEDAQAHPDSSVAGHFSDTAKDKVSSLPIPVQVDDDIPLALRPGQGYGPSLFSWIDADEETTAPLHLSIKGSPPTNSSRSSAVSNSIRDDRSTLPSRASSSATSVSLLVPQPLRISRPSAKAASQRSSRATTQSPELFLEHPILPLSGDPEQDLPIAESLLAAGNKARERRMKQRVVRWTELMPAHYDVGRHKHNSTAASELSSEKPCSLPQPVKLMPLPAETREIYELPAKTAPDYSGSAWALPDDWDWVSTPPSPPPPSKASRNRTSSRHQAMPGWERWSFAIANDETEQVPKSKPQQTPATRFEDFDLPPVLIGDEVEAEVALGKPVSFESTVLGALRLLVGDD